MTPEGKTKALVVTLLKDERVYHFFPATHGYGRSGIADIVACVAGKFLAIECKAPGKKPTALQLREIDRVRLAGGTAVVVSDEGSLEALRRWLKNLK